MRVVSSAIIGLLLLGGPPSGWAQSVVTPNAPAGGPGAGSNSGAGTAAARPYRTLATRFQAANATHDGRLTLDQARAGMPRVAEHFDEIDTDKKGYVTMDQVRTYAMAWRRAHPNGFANKQ